MVVEAGHLLLLERDGFFEFPAEGDDLGLDLELGEVVAIVGDVDFRLAGIRRGSFGSGAGVPARWVNLGHLKVLDVRPQVMADAAERFAPDAWPPRPLRLHA